MRQIVYISSVAATVTPEDLSEILSVSQANNRRSEVTGLLYFDGKRFLQAIEGDDPQLSETLTRIRADDRHRAMVILSDRPIAQRQFGAWAMAERRPDQDGSAFLSKVSLLVAGASPNVRATFESFIGLRNAT